MSKTKTAAASSNGSSTPASRSSPVIDLGRARCSDLPNAERREWLVTNGIGGYAAGTVSGMLTRRYHGLLIAALHPPLGRTLLVTKLDETMAYDGTEYPLYANRWEGDFVDPEGYHHIDRFHLEGTTPVWTYVCADAVLQKRVWMEYGQNTTYIRYDLVRATGAVTLGLKALVNYRDYHSSTHADTWSMHLEPVEKGVKVVAFEVATPFYLRSDHADLTIRHDWHRNYALSIEAYRGLDAVEDHLDIGLFEATLEPGQTLTIALSTEETADTNGTASYQRRQVYEGEQLAKARLDAEPAAVRHLALAADQFIVERSTPDVPDGRSIIAGYPWFSDWGRDTMIALPGLTLSTGRADVAARILRTFAQYVDQGMLPNRFPDAGEVPEYNTIDATLWYFEAVRAYYEATGDKALLRDLYPVLKDIIKWHRRGTRYQIHVDPEDGLLYGGEPGVQLTWMDAKVGDWVVTPRIGKPVEVNALWYHALCVMDDIASDLKKSNKKYREEAKRVKIGFARFWNPEAGYCYDVLDTPDGNDASLRPNQLFAVALKHSPLDDEKKQAIVDTCAQRLYTPHGMRSLDAHDPAFAPAYGGNTWERDGAYHQGTVWGWLIGPFVEAHLRVYGDKELARSYLLPLLRHLDDHGLGSVSEVFDAIPPFTPRGCFAQAWSVAELLRMWVLTRD